MHLEYICYISHQYKLGKLQSAAPGKHIECVWALLSLSVSQILKQ